MNQQAIGWVKYDARTAFFVNAVQYINWELIDGDILEFGVSVGKSLALLSQLYHENLALWQYTEPECVRRRIVGFDSFEGLPTEDEPHPRWTKGSFASNYLQGHPALAFTEQITPDAIRRLFSICGLPIPSLEVGPFSQTMPAAIPERYSKAAIVHIDSDLYSSAKAVLNGVAPILQDGALLLFDDWFMYRGNPNKGEARAFHEFLDEHPEWQAIQYQPYSVFCNSFILSRRG